ncbi:hypothetical protein GOL75_14385 [Sinorhizobium medicae]|nr:hypothetical protein [Sinorhizobium medicae]MDX1162505.1 hypothetical protein [Sinorhizobium medicae]
MKEINWDSFVEAAKAQHRGGMAFAKGSEFQVFAEAVEFLRLAANLCSNGIGPDPSFATEVQGSRVDDLHVSWGDPVRAWRYQIKAVEDLEWGLKLETQFKQEAYFFPASKFYLIVHDPNVADRLEQTRADFGLDFVEVDFLDIKLQTHPFNSPDIKELLDKLIVSNEKSSHHLATWTAIFGTWGRCRNGHFSEIWADVSEASKYTLRPLQATLLEEEERARAITLSVGSLSVAADGDIIILSNDVLFSELPLPTRMALSDDRFWDPMPGSAWELLERLGAIEDSQT